MASWSLVTLYAQLCKCFFSCSLKLTILRIIYMTKTFSLQNYLNVAIKSLIYGFGIDLKQFVVFFEVDRTLEYGIKLRDILQLVQFTCLIVACVQIRLVCHHYDVRMILTSFRYCNMLKTNKQALSDKVLSVFYLFFWLLVACVAAAFF